MIYAGLLALSVTAAASPNGGPLGDFEAHGDIGSPKIGGYSTWNAASQVYTLSAGGVNIWAKRDEFQFAYRKAKGEDTAQTEMPAAKGATVIQLERRGPVFILSAARFGEPFEIAQIDNQPNVPEEAYVGLFLSSHNVDVKETAVFRHVRVIKPVKVGFTPYRDYIGSRLEILNVTSGHRNVVYSSRVPFEAPNWLPDGSALLYNASGGDPATRGRLWKFDLATRTPSLVDTGFAIRNNNDHVLS